jgi:chromosome segregation ATPase
MAGQAKVTSVEALESFRASLVLYLSKARPTIEEAADEVSRTRAWLQGDRRCHWEAEVRRRARALEEAQAELLSARLSSFREATTAQQQAVHKAKRALAEAEAKLDRVRKWNRDFENPADPLVKQVQGLHTFLVADMAKAVAFLAQLIRTLEAYAEAGPPSAVPAMAESPATPPTDTLAAAETSAAGPASSFPTGPAAPEGSP